MSGVVIVFAIILIILVLFIWNRFPAPLVAVGTALALYFTGVLTAEQALSGLGSQIVVLIASLFVISTALDVAGVTAWASQFLIRQAGESRTRLTALIMLICMALTAVVSVNAAVPALIPVVVVIALRLKIPPSKLLLMLPFAAHAATNLTLLGAPLNVLGAAAAAETIGHPIGFFEFAVAGIPISVATILLTILVGNRLLPVRTAQNLPPDLSRHGHVLVEHYGLDEGPVRLRVRRNSSLVGTPVAALDLAAYPGVALSKVYAPDGSTQADGTLAENAVLLVQGPAAAVTALAEAMHLAPRESASINAESPLSPESGLAEVVIPPRSDFIGQAVYPGMTTADGDLIIQAVQRGGEDVGREPLVLAAGDILVLQGSWAALDKRLGTPDMLVVDPPEQVRRQAVPLGAGSKRALAVVVVLIALLASGVVPPAVAALVCAGAMILSGVINLNQAYRGIDWSTVLLVGGTTPLAAAMTQTGAAELIAETLIGLVGGLGPYALMAGIFIAAAAINQLISNTAVAIMFLPIAIATAHEVGVSPMPMIICVIVAANAALLTPVATPTNLMVYGPGGYRFGDYWVFGLPLLIIHFLVAVYLVPLYWPF